MFLIIREVRSSFLLHENELLLSCSCINPDKDRIKDILSNRLNWDYIGANAGRHGISSLLYRNLSNFDDLGVIPDKVMKHLKGQYFGTIARNRRHYDELRQILQSFKDAGIPVIILKGAAFAEIVYHDIGLRGFNDIDIMVRKEDLQKAKNTAIDAGYALDKIPEAIYEKFGYNLHYIKKTTLEIHWNITRRTGSERYTKIEIEELWKNVISSKVLDFDILVLSPEDQLLHLCIHLAGHRYNRVIWFCDISEIIEHYNVNWELVLKNAKKYRAQAYLYYGLYFTSKLLDADVPANVLQKLKPNNFDKKLFFSINKNIISGKKNILSQITPLFKLLLIDSYLDRLRYIGEYFFPPIDMLEERYDVSGFRIYLYRMAYPIYLVIKNFKRFASMIFPSRI
jgi:hypothetical protein